MFFRTELIFTGFVRRTGMFGNQCLPKHIKISKCYNFNEDFRPEECDSDKCDLKMAIAAIMVAILAVLQCSNYKEN
jgi:hypothetical protein